MNKRFGVMSIVVASLVFPLAAHGQSWSTEFEAPPTGNGLDSSAQALLEYQGWLIVAGSFTQAGPLSVNRIAAWDGTQWSALGGGLIETAEALAEYEGDLIAAGGSGAPSGAFLMRWDGATWTMIPSPTGTAGIFESVCSYNGSLFVGTFESGLSKLAWWDGTNWSSVPVPLDPVHTSASIEAMTVWNGQLFVTGVKPWGNGGFLFTWNGEAFGGPGWVLPSYGLSLHVYHELLYVGGDWFAEPPIADDGIAIWDQNGWLPFGTSVGAVWGMETYHGRIVLVGSYVTSFNGVTYDGQREQPVAGCVGAFAAREFQGDLYVAGAFDEICTENNVIQSSNIARWSEPTTSVSNIPKVAGKLQIESAPNPLNPSVTLTINLPTRSDVVVTISDATGRTVRRLATGIQSRGPYRVTWDGIGDNGQRLASGVYFARVTAGKETATAKLVLLK